LESSSSSIVEFNSKLGNACKLILVVYICLIIKECKLLVETNDSKNSFFFFNFGNLDNFLINFNFGYESIIISYKLILSY
jgi:hypothetical protein